MERAGRAAAEEALRTVKRLRPASVKAKVAVFCGKGNNGGDGLVCARYLASAGIAVEVCLLCKREELKGDAFYNMIALNKRKIKLSEISAIKKFNLLKRPFKADIIVDAVFGTGFKGRPGIFYKEIIKNINKSKARKIAIDVPSGLDSTTGIAAGAAVKACLTVTMGFAKTGFYKNDGPACCGEIKIADIGLRRSLL